MAEYTYFIISPGVDIDSYVNYSDGKNGNYIKFGDQSTQKPTPSGLRNAYKTHNPDIGVMAIMDSSAIASPYLGVVLKNYIEGTLHIDPVDTTEWFSIETTAAWKLAKAMMQWDEKHVQLGDVATLEALIAKWLA